MAPTLTEFLAKPGAALARGPVALIFAEDEVEIDSTLRHHLDQGFRAVLLLAPDAFGVSAEVAADPRLFRIRHDLASGDSMTEAVNALIDKAPGLWFYYGYNAEYLFYPFCETRSVGELLAFHTEERRDSMLSYVIDLYAPDLDRCPGAVTLEEAHLDRSGYYALGRPDPDNHNHPRERQLDFFGGLRRRFEEYIPENRNRIDRIALFRARPGLRLRANDTFSDEEYNTYACPWHNNLTAAVMSFRVAKALRRNPGSANRIHSFKWRDSVPFEWHSRQLLELGLMEPGQWF
ncbi:MAG: hypothetical protein H5U16_03915 [Roseovarius sp.]|nr:hypothetical protein [Roseovarius sp.]